MDCKIFNVNGQGFDRLLKAIELAMFDHTAHSWKQDSEHRLIYCWATADAENGLVAFPAPMGAENIARMAWAWLETINHQEATKIIGHPPNHDGGTELGWIVSCDHGGFYAILSVHPHWIIFGK